MRKLFLAAFTLATLSAANSASAQIVFDNQSRQDFLTNRGVGDSPLAVMTVTSTQSFNSIGAFWDPSGNGNLKFVIYNLNTSTLLFSTAASPFVDAGLKFYSSGVFPTFNLNAGISYGIGAIADVAGLWGTNNSSSGNPYTQGGFTASDDRNANVANFGTPTLVAEGSAMIILQLGNSNTVVPEPGSFLLMGAGLAGTLVAVRRRRNSAR